MCYRTINCEVEVVKKIKIHILLSMFLLSSIVHGKGDFYPSAESALLAIHDCLAAAMCDCGLGEKLVLKSVVSACKVLHALRKLAVASIIKDEKISYTIVQKINEHLLHNPKLIVFLKNLNTSLEPHLQLSDNDIATVLKNSALLWSINEVHSLGEILRVVQCMDNRELSSQRLNALLKEVELDTTKCALQLWEKRDYLRRLYARLEYQASTVSEKIKLTKKSARAQKIINTITLSLGITDEYADALKRLEPFGGCSYTKLYELYEDAFDGQTETLNMKAYALSIEKSRREQEG